MPQAGSVRQTARSSPNELSWSIDFAAQIGSDFDPGDLEQVLVKFIDPFPGTRGAGLTIDLKAP